MTSIVLHKTSFFRFSWQLICPKYVHLLGLLLGGLFFEFCCGPTALAQTEAWVYPSAQYRCEVTLPPYSQSRIDAPIIINFEAFNEPVDLNSVRIDEITGGSVSPVEAAAYAQESGRGARAYWTASGTTASGQERSFLLYFNKAASHVYSYNWDRSSQTFGGSKELDQRGPKYFWYLRSNKMELLRGARNKITDDDGDPQRGVFYERNPDNEDFNHLKNTDTNYSPVDGFRTNYALLGLEFEDRIVLGKDDRSSQYVKYDRNGPSGAMTIGYAFNDGISHKTEVTHRLFKNKHLLEFSVTVTADDGRELNFARDLYHSRSFYYTSDFNPNRLNTNYQGDESITGDSNVKNWHILHRDGGDAIGLFTFKPASKEHNTSGRYLLNKLDQASDRASEYVYYAQGKRDDILKDFETMFAGYPLGEIQQQQFDFVEPARASCWMPGEAFPIKVEGPSVPSGLVVRVVYPDGSSQALTPNGSVGASTTFDFGTIPTDAPQGNWVLEASGDGATRSKTIRVTHPVYPNAIITPGELAATQTRWATDLRYQTDVETGLMYKAKQYYEYGPVSSSPTGSGTLRRFARGILSYASYLMMAPAEDKYRTRMWSDIDTMLSWANWDPMKNRSDFFATDELARPEMLQNMLLAFDWHRGDLSIPQQRAYAEKFANCVDSIIELNYARRYPSRYTNYNWIHNNRYFIQNSSLALADRILGASIPEARRKPWRDRADYNFANVLLTLPADGSDNSGNSYYTHSNYSLFLWAESCRLNGNSTVYDHPYFQNTPYNDIYGQMPGRVGNFGGVMPYGNCDQGPFNSHRMTNALLAVRTGNGKAQWFSNHSDYARVGALRALWQTYEVRETPVEALPNWHYFSDRDIFVFRSSWSNDAMYFSTKCGPIWGGHEHPDSGTFVIHRNGFPYIAAPHYLKNAFVTDENIMLVNDKGLRGRSENDAYTKAVEPQYWGHMKRVLGSDDYFNVLSTPAKAYEADAELQSYTREFVGFNDLVIMRDIAQATENKTFKLLLHGYKTDEQTKAADPYDPLQHPNDEVFFNKGNNLFHLLPNPETNPHERMDIQDISKSDWSSTTEAWRRVPEKIPGYVAPGVEREYNDSRTTYSAGRQLRRTLSNTSSANSMIVMHFRGDAYEPRQWLDSSSVDDGMILVDQSGNELIRVAWLKNNELNGSHNVNARGAMMMINDEDHSFGGRDLEYLHEEGLGINLLSATSPITLHAKTQADTGNKIHYLADQDLTVRLYHPTDVEEVWLNDNEMSASDWSWSDEILTLSLPAASSVALVRTVENTGPSAEAIIDYLLGLTSNATAMDNNGDGKVDIADVINRLDTQR